MRKLFLTLGATGAVGNFSLVIWDAVSMASSPGAAVVAGFQKGFLTTCALLGPMLGVHFIRKLAWPLFVRLPCGVVCAALVLTGMVYNGKQSLDAYMKTTDKTIAERSKAKDAATMALDELKKLQALPPLSVPPTNAEAVKAAEDALKAATRLRVARCGENDEWVKRSWCQDALKDERTARGTHATTVANKNATDAAEKATARKAVLEAELKASPAVTDADPGSAVWVWLFGIDPALGRTWQGIMGVLLIEAFIAFLLFAFEVLQVEGNSPIARASELAAPPPQKAVMGSVARYFERYATPARGKRISQSELMGRYTSWCERHSLTAHDATAFATHLLAICKHAGIRTKTIGDELHVLDYEIAA